MRPSCRLSTVFSSAATTKNGNRQNHVLQNPDLSGDEFWKDKHCHLKYSLSVHFTYESNAVTF